MDEIFRQRDMELKVYRSEEMELRAGDRVRWTRNDPGSGLVNGEAAVVESIEKEGVRFRLESGKEAGLDEAIRNSATWTGAGRPRFTLFRAGRWTISLPQCPPAIRT